jgi:hypothetical protein
MLQLFAGAGVALLTIAAVTVVLVQVDWGQLMQRLLELGVLIGLLYWVTTLLPGPVKKVGRIVGKQLGKAMKGGRKPQ